MKIPVYVIPLFLLLWTLSGTAQDSSTYILTDHEARDTVSRYIYQLRKNGADTVIRFDLPPTHPSHDTRPYYSEFRYPNSSYIFYRTGNKTFVTRYTWSEKAGQEINEYFYIPRELPGDTLFNWFAHNLEVLRKEYLLPFITETKTNGKGYYYQPWRAHHPSPYRIVFFTPSDREYRQVTTDDLDKQNREGMINLNYEANTQTKLFQLFLLLKERYNETFIPSLPKAAPSWDTIQFSLPLNFAYRDSIPGLGKLYRPLLVIYTIVRKDHQLMTQMKLTYQQERCNGLASAISDWLPINNDTLLSWLDSHAAAIKSEDLRPFARRWEVNGVPHYDYGISAHSPTYHLSVITPQENIWKAIDLDCLESSTHEGRTHNLNYPYNTSTTLYQLYSKLRQYTEAWDSRFVLHQTRE